VNFAAMAEQLQLLIFTVVCLVLLPWIHATFKSCFFSVRGAHVFYLCQ